MARTGARNTPVTTCTVSHEKRSSHPLLSLALSAASLGTWEDSCVEVLEESGISHPQVPSGATRGDVATL